MAETLRPDPLTADRPPAPPNGCQKYHGVPGCRCQLRASREELHRGAHHCNEHDRYWTDREEMYGSMYISVVTKWAALLEHFDLAEDAQPDEVIEAADTGCVYAQELAALRAATPDPAEPTGFRPGMSYGNGGNVLSDRAASTVEPGLDVERLAEAMRSCDGVNWPKAWRSAEHNFDWVARQVAAAYRRTPDETA